MRIWILQTGEPLQVDGTATRPMRIINLSNALAKQGHSITIWTSNFDHYTKKHRYKGYKSIQFSQQIKINLINSIGYRSHTGLFRILDHIQLALNLKKAIRHEVLPDVAFIGYPPIEIAFVLSKFLKKNNVPFMVDVKDIWPDNFGRYLPKYFRVFTRVIFWPYYLLRNAVFKSCQAISAPTDHFINWVNMTVLREPAMFDLVSPLTVPISNYSTEQIKLAEKSLSHYPIWENATLKICFIGSITNVFDFDPLIYCSENFDVKFFIAGTGPKFKNISDKTLSNPNFTMIGRVDHAQATVLAGLCDAMIAPVRDLPDFNISIPNKFYDAMALGKPIITSIQGYAKNFVMSNKIGFTYESKSESLMELLIYLSMNPTVLLDTGANAKNIYMEKFSVDLTYDNLCENLINLKLQDEFKLKG